MGSQKASTEPLSFVGHLEELRSRLIISFISFSCACLAVFFVAKDILSYLIKPIGFLIFTSPLESFGAHMTIVFAGGLILAFPVFLYQLWQFMSSALTPAEKKLSQMGIPVSIAFFLIGAVFAFEMVLPLALKFLMSFSSSRIHPMITIGHYVSFVAVLVLGFGILFELPVIIVMGVRLGLIEVSFLSHYRKNVIVCIFILSAFLTPPDCLTQILLALPLVFLYEISVLAVRLLNIASKKGNHIHEKI